MSSEFYTPGGINPGRSNNMLPINNTTQIPFRPPLAGALPDPAAQLLQRRPALINGKRSLSDFQIQQNHLHQQQQNLGMYLRNVKQRMYQQASSPISPLSPMNLSSLSEGSFNSSLSNSSSNINPRYGVPILQQPRALNNTSSDMFNGMLTNSNNFNNFLVNQTSQSNLLFQNQVQNSYLGANLDVPISSSSLQVQESETRMMNRLQELEKELLDDNDEEDQGCEEVSGVVNSEWSETYQNLIVNQTEHKQQQQQQLISLSPTSSTSSCSSTSTSASQVTSPKQLVIDAASAISEGKTEAALEILTRLSQVANSKGTPEQRLTAYMVSALRWRVNSTEFSTRVSEIFTPEHTISTHKLYDYSACFKLGFMAANLAILGATNSDKVHVVDFDIGQGGQYVHLLYALGAKKDNKPSFLKITTFTNLFGKGNEAGLKVVGDTLKALASKIGIGLAFNVMSLKINDLTREKLGLESDEDLAVNFGFKLYRLPDESVTTENLRDEVLRRVKRLSPKVVTVVEQEMNCNTSGFVARVNEVFGYYNSLFESLEGVVPRESSDRVLLEEGLGRRIANSVACEGSERVERCEVFGKWRARMGMAGFGAKPMSQLVADSLRSKLCTMTRGNRGFTVSEQSGGICFGWMGRSLTVASAWH